MDGGRSYIGPGAPDLNYSALNNNFLSYDYGGHVKPLVAMASGSNESQSGASSSSQWIQRSNEPRSYVELLGEGIAKAPAAKVFETVHLPVGGGTSAIDVKSEPFGHDEGKSFSFGSGSHHVEVEMLKLLASNSYKALIRSLKTENGGEVREEVTSFDSLTQTQQSETLCEQESVHDIGNAFGVPSKESSSRLPDLSQPQRRALRKRDVEKSRIRRLKFAQRLKTLQELLPYPVQGQLPILTAAVDYIKYMQLQMKELCQLRLWREQASTPFMFPEAHDNFTLHEQMMHGSLEGMKGKSPEMNHPSAPPTQLLGSTYMMPMSTTIEGFYRLT